MKEEKYAITESASIFFLNATAKRTPDNACITKPGDLNVMKLFPHQVKIHLFSG
jgi:hypothetical protein